MAASQRGVLLQRVDPTVSSALSILNQAGFDLTPCDIDITVGAHAFGGDQSDIIVEVIGGGPSISLSAPDFGGSTYYEGVDDNDITVSLRGFEPLASYSVTVASDGGGTPPAAANGTTDGNGESSEVIDITGLDPGQITFTATAGAEVATRTATLLGASAGQPIGLLLTLTKAA